MPFSLVVATDEPRLTPLQVWRIKYFASLEPVGIAADDFDAHGDGRTNRQEFEDGTDPLVPSI